MAGGLLVFGTDQPALIAVDASSGTVRWTIPLASKPRALAATVERIYFGGEDGKLYSYPTDGKSKPWVQNRILAIGPAAVDAKAVYFALLDNSVRAFSANHGPEQWDQPVESRPVTGPMRFGENLAVALTDGRVVELETKKGKPVSPKTDAGPAMRLLTAAVSSDGTRIYTVTIDGKKSLALVAWSKR
jgi:outer membrane protein assembly factor BamB